MIRGVNGKRLGAFVVIYRVCVVFINVKASLRRNPITEEFDLELALADGVLERGELSDG